jgi:hypothetical protein
LLYFVKELHNNLQHDIMTILHSKLAILLYFVKVLHNNLQHDIIPILHSKLVIENISFLTRIGSYVCRDFIKKIDKEW